MVKVKRKATKRRRLTAAKREQVRRVRERVAGDEYWLNQMGDAIAPAENLGLLLAEALECANRFFDDHPNADTLTDADRLSGAELRRMVQQLRTLAELSRLVGVGIFRIDWALTEKEEEAWERWYVRFSRAARFSRAGALADR